MAGLSGFGLGVNMFQWLISTTAMLLFANLNAFLANKLAKRWAKNPKKAVKIWFIIGSITGGFGIITLFLVRFMKDYDAWEENENNEYWNSEYDEKDQHIKYSLVLASIIAITYITIFVVDNKSDDRTNSEKALDSYCERQGRSGCSDNYREVKRIIDQ